MLSLTAEKSEILYSKEDEVLEEMNRNAMFPTALYGRSVWGQYEPRS